ncbi:MAG TPA: HPr(Ser) kinase/phosphatase [Rhodanobacteraceae bacterium]|nr:HPr(Ser) kinase/phosphatase [Rhodanobacteraceae bacterium]
MNRLSAHELFDDTQDRLALRWVAGQAGRDRELQAGGPGARRPSEVGYLNIIYPNKLQIVGGEELNYLDGLDSRQRWETVQKIFAQQPIALIVTKDQSVPADLRDAAEETGTPLWVSSRRGHDILTLLQYKLARALAPQVTLHGVFMEVHSIGVLITGTPGSGKSELALELITRGHRLIADDAPEFTLIAPDVIDGACPEILRDLLEVRGLGVLNVREMFGHTAVKPSKYLRLIVHLRPADSEPEDAMLRLTGDIGVEEVLDVKIPRITLPVAPGRNLAVLVEAAVRNHMLKSQGIDQARIFMDRQAARLQSRQPG